MFALVTKSLCGYHILLCKFVEISILLVLSVVEFSSLHLPMPPSLSHSCFPFSSLSPNFLPRKYVCCHSILKISNM